jgi:hypothetical protein
MNVCIVDDPEVPLDLHEEREPHGFLSFFVLPHPSPLVLYAHSWQPPRADLYLLPVGLALDAAEAERLAPRFAYGSARYMAEAFRSGCADYLRSPWSLDEVEARASRFLLLRFSVCDTELIFSGRSIATERESVALTENEYRILRILVLSLNRPVPREAFALALWGEVRPRSRAVDVQISVLRGKLQGLLPAGECPLTFSRGRGYRLEGKCCG